MKLRANTSTTVTLDDFFRRATTAAFGADSVPFIWLTMSFAVLSTLVLSFGAIYAMYVFDDTGFEASSSTTATVSNEETYPLTKSSSSMTTVKKRPPQLRRKRHEEILRDYVHYLDENSKSFYVSAEK